MKAKSIKGNSIAAIKIALGESMADGFRPTLAIAFISVKKAFDLLEYSMEIFSPYIFLSKNICLKILRTKNVLKT